LEGGGEGLGSRVKKKWSHACHQKQDLQYAIGEPIFLKGMLKAKKRGKKNLGGKKIIYEKTD